LMIFLDISLVSPQDILMPFIYQIKYPMSRKNLKKS